MPSSKHQPRQRNRHTFHPPPLFWAKLTKLWLTKSALREADRRYHLLSSNQSSSSPRPHIFAPDFLRNCSATCLQEIRKLSRRGGPDLSGIRNYPAPAHFSQDSMDPTDSSLERSTQKTGNTTVYDPHFESHLYDHGIFMPNSTYPDGTKPCTAENIAEIQRRLRAPRPSLALSEDSLQREFGEFTLLNDSTSDEQLVIKKILPILDGPQQQSSSFHDGGNHPFKNLAPLTDGTLANAKPDIYHGAPPHQLHPRVREQLSDQIIPTRQGNRPITPNFFVEAKGHCGSPPVLKRQALYDSALGARAMHALQQYGSNSSNRPQDDDDCSDPAPAPALGPAQDSTRDNHAYTIASTFQDGTLGIYATHPTRNPSNLDPGAGRQTDYVMTRVGHYSLIGSPESYQQGLRAYRNSRDLAKEYRDGFIRQANERHEAVRHPSQALEPPHEIVRQVQQT
ncbi:hypothetical protein P170DRAFT_445640 [Aspergillus steynii IBT 23096]|uniref:Uncharacterized protein n=1 Tax=Aspergillus steynii IBT 23096 TaxID=1392250 RepID=A0A2I2GBT8_9EURO|nr:uncharacterized protein P170DRAFT_445640 [Aspergillus steynii IBT 23096]PLB50307.1 hypothetical protein P170DRAFT_445640 [Aspergillus steynii IBT 23096]